MRRPLLVLLMVLALASLAGALFFVMRSTSSPAEPDTVFEPAHPEPFGAGRGPRFATRTVAGTVTDRRGQPIAGARVAVGGEIVTTDAEGRFDVDGVPRRVRDALVEAPGHRAERVALAPGDTLVTPELVPVRSVPFSLVLPNGLAARGVRLLVREGKNEPLEVRARADGTFDELQVWSGTAYVIFPAQRVGGRPFQRASTTIRRGDPVFLEPEPGEVITGRVLDPDGSPVEGALVEARRYESGSYPIRDGNTTDAAGRFEVILDPGAETGLRVTTQTRDQAAGFRFATRHFQATAGDTDVEIRLAPGYRTTGVLLTPEGEPAPGVRIDAYHNWRRPGGSSSEPGTGAVTDAEGRFVLGGLRKGWVWLSIPKDIADANGWLLREEAEAGAEDVELRIAGSHRVLGTLLDAAGGPVHTMNLLLTDGNVGRELRSHAGTTGAFVFERVPPGTYRAQAIVPGHNGWVTVGEVSVPVGRPPDLAAGHSPRIELRAPPPPTR